MKSIGIAVAALLLVTFSAGYAANLDNAAPPAVEKSIAADAGSYFQGVWTGKWPWGNFGVDVTVAIGKMNKDGLLGTRYSWGSGQWQNGRPIQDGTIKGWGKVQGDQFILEWKSKDGYTSSVTLKKEDENTVKATIETDRPAQGGSVTSNRQTTLKRK
ncbi:MAG: hypothetical protein FIA93_05195 [Deltaproteobacteria bacterium]|nr:hypothetical protein [Deltaproteobacteria bacterium]PWB60635.1 MAG: hypothetical protein C3F14_12865 [Deltaproteobacteria bacterium]